VKVRQLVGVGLRVLAVASLVTLVPASAAFANGHYRAAAPLAGGGDDGHAGHNMAGMSFDEHMAAMTVMSDVMKTSSLYAAPAPPLPVPVPPDVAVSKDGKYGPLGPADIDLVVKVRLAGLWEQPAGDMAVKKGASPRVREIGKMISEQHAVLDQLDRNAAAKLGIQVPNEPNADQQYWLGEMKDASGAQFDRIFVDRLRAAHGKVFSVIADVRAGTRNDVVRELASQSNQFVSTHLTLLESTDMVDWQHLALPPEPPDGPVARAGYIKSGVDPMVIWVVLGLAVVAGGITTIRVVRPR
jgi:predicted outer membrane protein